MTYTNCTLHETRGEREGGAKEREAGKKERKGGGREEGKDRETDTERDFIRDKNIVYFIHQTKS